MRFLNHQMDEYSSHSHRYSDAKRREKIRKCALTNEYYQYVECKERLSSSSNAEAEIKALIEEINI